MSLRMEKDKEKISDGFFDEAPWWGEYLAQYREAAKYAKGARVLDVGCGFGFGSRYLFDNGAIDVVGLDINKKQLGFAQKKFARDGVSFREQRAEEMKFAAKSFDLVTCFQVLERSTNPDEVIYNIHKSLDKGGVALISTVNRLRGANISDSPIEETHLLEFDLIELKQTLKKHFSKVDVRGLYCTRDESILFRNPLTEKIPHKVRDMVAKKVFGQSFFPSENEFILKNDEPEEAPLFYAICKKT